MSCIVWMLAVSDMYQGLQDWHSKVVCLHASGYSVAAARFGGSARLYLHEWISVLDDSSQSPVESCFCRIYCSL